MATLLFTLFLLATAQAADTKTASELKREHEWRLRQLAKEKDKAEKERQHRNLQSRLESERFQAEIKRKQAAAAQKAQADRAYYQAIKTPRPFDPETAPDPKTCYVYFMKKIRSSKSFEEIIGCLRYRDQLRLQREQSNWDPQQVLNQLIELKQRSPHITKDEIVRRAKSPYENELSFYKSIAKSFNYVQSVRIKGNKASLVISVYDHSADARKTAIAELVGEDRFWRLDSYNEHTTRMFRQK